MKMRRQPHHTLAKQASTPCESKNTNTTWAANCIAIAKNVVSEPFQKHNAMPLDTLLMLCLKLNQGPLWTEFVCRSQPVIAAVVLKTIRRRVNPSASLVDDLVQEVYLKLCSNNFRALRQFAFRHEKSLFGFLKVVASNTVQDYFRWSWNQKRGRGMPAMQLDCIKLSNVLAPSPENTERAILLGAIDKCLDNWADNPNIARDREIFWLYYRFGLTAKAISALPSIRLSVKGVESTLFRMVQLVRLKLKTNAPSRQV